MLLFSRFFNNIVESLQEARLWRSRGFGSCEQFDLGDSKEALHCGRPFALDVRSLGIE
jgi:hypothetical protein